MAKINLEHFSIDELDKLKSTIDLTIVNKRQNELLNLRQTIDDLIDESPFTLEEVLAAKPGRKSIPPKYRNPEDDSQTWTGRGRKPKWVEAYLQQGKDLDDLAID
ncbi:MAG: H-NS histone family protein [Thiolinea sp.]